MVTETAVPMEHQAAMQSILRALATMQYGSVTVIVHERRIMRIESVEKTYIAENIPKK